jgi:site-specific DNA recombinase
MKNNLRAVIYFRSNNREQFETENDIQVHGCKEYAEQNNMQVVGVYKDQFVSGRSTKGRDGFNQMIEDSSKDLFDVVLVHRIDRFSRSTEDYFTFENVLYENGVELISVTSPLEELNTCRTLVALIANAMEENLHDDK